jgi:hypothetical protein
MKITTRIAGLRAISKNAETSEGKRLNRLKEAKENKDIRYIATAWADHQLKPKILSGKQREAIYLMTDFVHNFSNVYIAERLGLNLKELSTWRNDPLFIKELDKEITRRKSFIRIHAFRNVHRAILRGDMKATWNYLKMSGDLKENIEVTDRTGEHELSDEELNVEIAKLNQQIANGPVLSTN